LNTTIITYRPRVKTDFKQYTVHTMVCTHYKYWQRRDCLSVGSISVHLSVICRFETWHPIQNIRSTWCIVKSHVKAMTSTLIELIKDITRYIECVRVRSLADTN